MAIPAKKLDLDLQSYQLTRQHGYLQLLPPQPKVSRQDFREWSSKVYHHKPLVLDEDQIFWNSLKETSLFVGALLTFWFGFFSLLG